jgi:hypothetical protein
MEGRAPIAQALRSRPGRYQDPHRSRAPALNESGREGQRRDAIGLPADRRLGVDGGGNLPAAENGW